MWFTDGIYDVEDRLDADYKQRGRDNRGESQNKSYAQDVDLYIRGNGNEAENVGKGVCHVAGHR
jgi:hypothetical protein